MRSVLGCPRYTVRATLTGRLDAVEKAGFTRDSFGVITAIQGFGNLNRYRARLVLQSVTEVAADQIDYSKKIEPQISGEGLKQSSSGETVVAGDPVQALRSAASRLKPGGFQQVRISDAAKAFGEQGEENGVVVGFGRASAANDVPTADPNSPDGVVFQATFDVDKLKGTALAVAIAHVGTHIADFRSPRMRAAPNRLSGFPFEWRAWQTSILAAETFGEGRVILPEGTLAWSGAWKPDAVSSLADRAITEFVMRVSGLKESSPHDPWSN